MTNDILAPDAKEATPTLPSSHSSASLVMDNASMDKLMRVADMMASGRSTVPAHLQKSAGDCLAVTMQAMQWGMNPFAVAQKTHVVNGALGYEAQLVNAVVQSSGAITGRFHYEYRNSSPHLECRVGAVIRGEEAITWGEWLSESKVTTKNSPLWKTNPSQQLGYLQVKNWARAHTPGAILGVYTPDELAERAPPKDMGDVIPAGGLGSDWSPEALTRARAAAAKGAAAYGAFWKGLPPEEQTRLFKTPEHAAFKADALKADNARTFDSGATSDETYAPKTTFAQVMESMVTAKTMDELADAADWIGEIPDEQQRKELTQKYNTLAAEMEAGQ